MHTPFFTIAVPMKFNEQEVGKPVQRASELHEEALSDANHDLTLSEIESIANELGIPSRYLLEAALEGQEPDSTKTVSLSGAPFRVDQTRVVDGAVTEKQWEEVLIELQEFSGKSGKVELVGDSRRWKHAVGEGDSGFNFEELKVVMRPVEGKTSIRLKHEYKGAVAMYFLAFGVSSFLTLLVAHSLPEVSKISELIYAGLGGVLSLGGVRAMIAVSARRYKERLAELADRLQRLVIGSEDSSRATTTELHSISSKNEELQTSILEDLDVSEPTGESVLKQNKGAVR